MSKDFSRSFYNSEAWRRQRRLYATMVHGLCERCGAPGEIVHHRKPLTQDNINDPMYTLSVTNLEMLCRSCHLAIHDSIDKGVYFDPNGDIHKID